MADGLIRILAPMTMADHRQNPRRDFPGVAPRDNARCRRGEVEVISGVFRERGEAWCFVASCRPSRQRVIA